MADKAKVRPRVTKLRKPKKAGGQSLYEPRFAEIIENLALLGATEAEISNVIGIDHSTLIRWKKTHPDFALAAERGRMQADGQVANRLYQRAMGFVVKSKRTIMVKGKPQMVEEEQQLPPDTAACIFWLKNRQRDKWRDRFDHTVRRIGGAQDLTDEELAALAKDGEEAAQAATSTRH